MAFHIKKIIIAAFLAALVNCDLPYEPQPEPGISTTTVESTGKSLVYSIVGTKQICNPSISKDTGAFPGCMLWLNFGGDEGEPVIVPESLQNYNSGKFERHDRLTIIDTGNVVRWFLKSNELGASNVEEFQDPEWTTHPGYLICLLSADAQRKWGSYVIHMKSRKHFKICAAGLDAESTPHLWIAPSATIGSEPSSITYDDDSLADTASVRQFLGTCNVKLVLSKQKAGVFSLYLKDFNSDEGMVALRRPVDRDGWDLESPLISPDGNWIVFNATKNRVYYETYLQRLSPDALPILFSPDASDPHWWTHPADSLLTFIVFQAPGSNDVKGDLSEKKYLETAELGVTYRQQIRLFKDAATESTAMIRMGPRENLVNLPTKGGLSPDGRFLCTGYDRAFIVRLQ